MHYQWGFWCKGSKFIWKAKKFNVKNIEIPKGGRHRKTTFVFVGDRFKPDSIDCHIVKLKKNGDGEFIKQDATD